MQTELGNRLDIDLIDQLLFNKYYRHIYAQEEENDMEQILDTNAVAPEVSPEELAKLLAAMEDMAGQPVTTDEAEPTDAERVLH